MVLDDKWALQIGQAICSAFLEDEELRQAILGPNKRLEQVASKSDNDLVKFGLQSSFNSHMVSAYHATRVIEIFHSKILDALKTKNHREWDILFLVMHSYAIEAVFGLYSSCRLFEQEPVMQILGDDASKIVLLFKTMFPRLKETRDALAHDDERIFGIVKNKKVGKTIGDPQFVSLKGTLLGCKDEKLQDIEFNFPPSQFINLLREISTVLKA